MTDARATEDALMRLIDAAERTVTARPPAGDLAELGKLVDAIACPVGVVLSGAHAMLMDALAIARERHDPRWLMIAGALLPMVRGDLAACFEARHQRLEPDAASAYRGGRS